MSHTDRTHHWGRFITSGILLVMLGAMFLAGLYAAGGRVVLEKALLHLAMPAGILWTILTFLLLQLRDRKSSPLFCMAALAWVTLMVLGSGHVSGFLAEHIEADYIQLKPLEETEPFEAIIVLGGGCSQGINGETQVNLGGERVVLAAKMFHKGLARKIICTGKNIGEINPAGIDPAEQYVRVLTQLNVPAAAIETIGGINTSEELKILGARFKEEQRVGLITSAWHLGRAMRLAETNGLVAQPLPAGFRTGEKQEPTVAGIMLSLIPNSEAIANISWSLREMLASLVGR